MSRHDEEIKRLLSGQLTNELDENSEPMEDEEPTFKPLEPVTYDLVESKNEPLSSEDQTSDYKLVRSNLIGLISRANSGLELALKLAGEMESPKALDSIVQLISASTNSSKELMKLHESINKNQPNNNVEHKAVTNNTQNNYYGSSEKKQIEELDSILDGMNDETQTRKSKNEKGKKNKNEKDSK